MKEPFIIHYVHGRYLIFETETLKHLREVHHICGVLIGTLPQISQQNVFLGLPQQIMLEEAAYLVRHGHAYIVNDRSVHQSTILSLKPAEIADYKTEQLKAAARKDTALRNEQAQRKRQALEKRGLVHLLEQSSSSEVPQTKQSSHVDTASSRVIYRPPSPSAEIEVGIQPSPSEARYDLFTHLHEKGYFMTPGLRFGAQYVAYPGDPLRFHSHFVATGHDWQTPIPVMDVVGGGRLGTGVKKAWLIGGRDPVDDAVKCFTVEWSGM